MRKVMIRNTILMLLATAIFAGALMLYLRSASSVAAGEPAGTTYTATAYGFGSDVIVTAGYNGDNLVSLKADASGETPAIGGAAAEGIVDAILTAGSADGVDAVASATLTSNAVLAAFADCEVQAGRISAEDAEAQAEDNTASGSGDDASAGATGEAATAIEDIEVTPGEDVYSASAKGYSSDVSVKLTYEDGAITALTIVAADETPEIGGEAATALVDAIISKGSANDVDAVAGATMTSNAILASVRYCENAIAEELYDVYQATAKGYDSDVVVTLYMLDGELVNLTVDASGETPAIGGKIAAQLQEQLLAAGNADGIDAVAGATVTSEAVLGAFADCLTQIG